MQIKMKDIHIGFIFHKCHKDHKHLFVKCNVDTFRYNITETTLQQHYRTLKRHQTINGLIPKSYMILY